MGLQKNQQGSMVPLINLLGNEEENFYQLGNKDKACFLKLKNHIQTIENSPFSPLKKGIFYLLKKNYDSIDQESSFYKALISYSDGLNINPIDLYFFIINGEVFSTSGPWPKGYLRNYTYSTSIYMKSPKSSKSFLIKNYEGPLCSKLSSYFRFTHTCFSQKLNATFLSYPGNPFPFHFVAFENGMQISSHQIISDTLHLEGKSLSQILYELGEVSRNAESIKDYFLGISALSSSIVNILIEDQKILEVTLDGPGVDFREIEIEKTIVTQSQAQFKGTQDFQSHYLEGLGELSQRESFDQDFKNELDALKKLCGTFKEGLNPFSFMNPFHGFCLGVDICEDKISYIEGPAPKNIENGTTVLSDIWENKTIQEEQVFRNVPKEEKNYLYRSLLYFNETQEALDCGDYKSAHHQVQMGLACLPKEHSLIPVYEFYFSIIEFLVDNNKKTRYRLINDFRDHLENTPALLHDHGKLFINRLERLIGRREVSFSDFNQDLYGELDQLESYCPRSMLVPIIKKSMAINIHLHIIEYGHHHFSKIQIQGRIA